MSGRVDPYVQGKVVEFYIAVANQNIDGILDTLVDLGTLSPEADREVMGQVLELAIEDARGEEIEQYRVNQIIDQVENTIYEFPLRLPSNLALVLRVATVVEGVCVTLDPDFNFIDTATEYLSEQGYREETAKQIAGEVGDQLRRTTESLIRVPPKIENTLDMIERDKLFVHVEIEDPNRIFDRLAKRLIYGLLLSVGLISTAIIYAFRGPDLSFLISGGLSLLIIVLLYRSFRKRRGIRARPQFTRQNLRQRRGEE
jgi:predicted unusual protein kinase regulating ubiquinone biosynthesis (AarF/ABC1/UbiB family)